MGKPLTLYKHINKSVFTRLRLINMIICVFVKGFLRIRKLPLKRVELKTLNGSNLYDRILKFFWW